MLCHLTNLWKYIWTLCLDLNLFLFVYFSCSVVQLQKQGGDVRKIHQSTVCFCTFLFLMCDSWQILLQLRCVKQKMLLKWGPHVPRCAFYAELVACQMSRQFWRKTLIILNIWISQILVYLWKIPSAVWFRSELCSNVGMVESCDQVQIGKLAGVLPN